MRNQDIAEHICEVVGEGAWVGATVIQVTVPASPVLRLLESRNIVETDNRVYQKHKNLFQYVKIKVVILRLNPKSRTEEHGFLRCSEKMQALLKRIPG